MLVYSREIIVFDNDIPVFVFHNQFLFVLIVLRQQTIVIGEFKRVGGGICVRTIDLSMQAVVFSYLVIELLKKSLSRCYSKQKRVVLSRSRLSKSVIW